MKCYMVTTMWGAMHVYSMRVFETDAKAWKYYDSLEEPDSLKRIYLLSSNEPPKLLKRAKV